MESNRTIIPEDFFTIYRTQLPPTIEYCPHVWGAAPKFTFKFLDYIQKHAIRLIDRPELTDGFPPLLARRKTGNLSIFYRYFIVTVSKKLLISSHR